MKVVKHFAIVYLGWIGFITQCHYEEAGLVKRLSPAAWRHINLFGRYKFNLPNILNEIRILIRPVLLQ